MIISFNLGEIKDRALAQEIGEKITEATSKEKYEYVLSRTSRQCFRTWSTEL